LADPQPFARAADNGGMKDIAATYADWLLRTTCNAFAQGCAQLADPPIDDVDHALRLLAPLAEALEGFAIGCTIGHVANAVRRWFGDKRARNLVTKLRRHIRTRATTETELADSLSAELAARLHARLVRMPTAAMVADAIEHVDDPGIATAFELACRDDLLEHRLLTELQLGWQHYRAAVAGALIPTTSPLWAQWSKKLRGDRAVSIHEYVLQVG
jgi:hypothetical protein